MEDEISIFLGKVRQFGLNFRAFAVYCQLSWLLFLAEVCIVLAPWIPWIPQVVFWGIWIRLWYKFTPGRVWEKAKDWSKGSCEFFRRARWRNYLPPEDLIISVFQRFPLHFIVFGNPYKFVTVICNTVTMGGGYFWIPNHDARFCEPSHIFSKKRNGFSGSRRITLGYDGVITRTFDSQQWRSNIDALVR